MQSEAELGYTFKTLKEETSRLFLQSGDWSQAFYLKWFLQVYANKSPLRTITYLHWRYTENGGNRRQCEELACCWYSCRSTVQVINCIYRIVCLSCRLFHIISYLSQLSLHILPIAALIAHSNSRSSHCTFYLSQLSLHILPLAALLAHSTSRSSLCTFYLSQLSLQILPLAALLAHSTSSSSHCTFYLSQLSLHILPRAALIAHSIP